SSRLTFSLEGAVKMVCVVALFVLLAFAGAVRQCGKNEVWTECTGCELQCGQDENTPCTANCRPPSCECSPSRGMRRNADGRCVPVSQCPKNFPRTKRMKKVLETKREVVRAYGM
uniref:TIL domain-containing protein n=1 Tax=Parascaris univalens TaxID=6257 RepID=A0A915AJV1_PARUN